jgi:hypothetical protein
LLGIGLALMPPGFGWLHHLPGIALITPRYAWVLIALPLTQAAGRGVAALDIPAGRRSVLLALMLVLGGFTSLALVRDSWPLNYGGVFRHVLATPEGIARLLVPPALAVAVVAACLWVVPRARLMVFTVLAVLEAVVIVGPYCRRPASAVLRQAPSPAVQFLQDRLDDGDGRMLGVNAVGHPFTPALFGLPGVSGVFGLPTRRYLEYLDAITPDLRPTTVQGIVARRSPLLDLGAVRYVVLARIGAPTALLDGDAEMPLAYADQHVAVYENRAALPRVRLVHQIVHVPDEDAARKRLAEIGSLTAHAQALGLLTTVAVEPDDDGHVCPVLGSATDGESVGIIDASDPDRLVIRARLASPALVVIADTYYPGWRARVDGAPASIFPTDLLFRGVFVTAGEHEIVLTYAPRSLTAGALACLAGCAACLVLFRRPATSRDAA